MSSPTSKPAQAEDGAQRPDVIAGDEVFFNHPDGPMSGKVLGCGEHGATIKCGAGVTHKIKWPHVLGLKKRAAQHYMVKESGEDGHLVVDAAGRRRYVAVPNEAHEDPLIAKASKGGTPFAGRPGLAKKVIVEKGGKKNTHWVKTGQDQPKERPAAAPKEAAKPHPNAAKEGEKIRFKAGDFAGQGTVVGKPGPKGAHVKDGSGRIHKVKWDEVVTKPDYAPRDEGETDKDYAKRAIDTQPAPKHLPEEHDKYFHTEGSSAVSVDRLHSTKSDEENTKGGDNTPKRMEAAYHGVLGKRPPITVAPHPKKMGHYRVLDGNGTLAGVKKAGWKRLPVNIVHEADYKCKEAAKEVADPAKFKSLPKKALQPSNDKEELLKLSADALEHLKKWLNKGKGVASRLGYQSMTKGPDDVTAAEYEKPGGMLFIAPLKTANDKGMARAEEKVAAYGGNWNQLTDIVRCTIAVDELHEMNRAMRALEKSGMKVTQIPKNRFLKPTNEGYMDINLLVEMPNGTQAEVQLNVKDMLRAKNDGHPYYEITRKLDDKHGEGGPKAQWPAEDIKAYQDAVAEQERIYGAAYKAHIEKWYGGDESKMIKSMERIILVLRK